MINIPVSIGELIDKWVILHIKIDRITDTSKLKHVHDEWDLLNQILYINDLVTDDVQVLIDELMVANETLWDIEDEIRNLESKKVPQKFFDFMNEGALDDDETEWVIRFVKLARLVYLTNDRRCAIKRQINELFNSELIEEKSYQEY